MIKIYCIFIFVIMTLKMLIKNKQCINFVMMRMIIKCTMCHLFIV